MAWLLGLSFRVDSNYACYYGSTFCDKNETHIWTQLLPQNTNYSIKNVLADTGSDVYKREGALTHYKDMSRGAFNFLSIGVELEQINASLANFTLSNFIDFNVSSYSRFHWSYFGDSFINRLFVKIMQKETQKAFEDYYAMKDKEEYEKLRNLNLNESLSLHWRCGDIMTTEKSGFYGFDGLSYYKRALDVLKMNGSSTIKNVYVIANLDANKSRHLDRKFMDDCNDLFHKINGSLYSLFTGHLGQNINYKLLSDGTVNSDMYILSHSKYVICGSSTFCFSAIGGNPHTAILKGNGNAIDTEYPPNFVRIFAPPQILKSEAERKMIIEYMSKWMANH